MGDGNAPYSCVKITLLIQSRLLHYLHSRNQSPSYLFQFLYYPTKKKPIQTLNQKHKINKLYHTDGTCDPNPEGYQERAGSRGLMVGWAPQQKVLSHPSIACFLSQCGWNSTLEGLSNGLPFLCWPYFDDQLLNESYICDIWKVGLRFDKNESGIITKGEIKNKMEQLLSDENFKVRASKLKEMAMNNIKEGGQSSKIFKNFIKWMKS
ncbi:hypothetical protein ACFX1R_025279 [Malus domestica]